MRYWRYKAYNVNFHTCEGVIKGNHLVNVAVELRQNGLQLIETCTIDVNTYQAELRLERQQKLIANKTESHIPETQPTETLIHWIIRKISFIFN